MPERGDSRGQESASPVAGALPLLSTAFVDHGELPGRFSRDGGNVSPPLEWSQVPSEAVELALLCTDPDAPRGTFTHWAVAGIPTSATGFDEGELPADVIVGRNDFGGLGWGGPHPPVGDNPHRYFFRLFALDQKLELAAGFSPSELQAAVERHAVAVGTLVGTFGR
jgi:Raf kinase inhibitor-like YbhB/YbcL family protein